jgi:hypothetical protein
MKSKYFILAQSFSRKTGKVVGQTREELIDLKTNELFKGVKSILDIKNSYESFWNDLNPRSTSVVFVQSIRTPFNGELKK